MSVRVCVFLFVCLFVCVCVCVCVCLCVCFFVCGGEGDMIAGFALMSCSRRVLVGLGFQSQRCAIVSALA